MLKVSTVVKWISEALRAEVRRCYHLLTLLVEVDPFPAGLVVCTDHSLLSGVEMDQRWVGFHDLPRPLLRAQMMQGSQEVGLSALVAKVPLNRCSHLRVRPHFH